MSTIIMAACWPLQNMSPAQKSVLISLADNSNDEGVCWPSVSKISMRTCLSPRAVQGALRWLEEVGLLVARQREGRSTVYEITPAAYAPPQEMRGAGNARTPADAAPTPAVPAPAPADAAPRTVITSHRTVKEPSVRAPDAPDGVSAPVWRDFVLHRRGKRAPLTDTAVKQLTRELVRAAGLGWMPDDALAETMAAGWTSLKADWLANRAAGSRPQPGAAPRAQPNRQEALEARNRQAADEWLRSQS